MPLYEYKCENGHVTTDIRSFANRTKPTTCARCRKDAFPIISAPAPTMGCKVVASQQESVVHIKGGSRDLSSYIWSCACGHRWDDICEGDPQPAPCAKCGQVVTSILGGFLFSKGFEPSTRYPYYNRALGCEVTSAGHLRALCKERGIEEVGTDYRGKDVDIFAEISPGTRAAQAETRRQMQEMQEDFRKMRAAYEDPMLKEQLQKVGNPIHPSIFGE